MMLPTPSPRITACHAFGFGNVMERVPTANDSSRTSFFFPISYRTVMFAGVDLSIGWVGGILVDQYQPPASVSYFRVRMRDNSN